MGGRAQGGNGGQREIVYKQPGTEVDIPITTGGCQVSRKKGRQGEFMARGTCACTYMLKLYSCMYVRMIEVMNDTSRVHDNNG